MKKEDCRNDCTPQQGFPKRPDNPPNRPALSRINYRIGTYADFRETLLHNLNQSEALSNWTHRGAEDPGIALLEGAAILGDILTFYQELYANEAYLRTARWRESISDLVRLVGYRLSPGLGGLATFAFEVKGNSSVVVPPNFPVKAEVEGLDKPADFETASELTAYPSLSKFNLYRPLEQPGITPQTTEFHINSPDQILSPVELKAGDRLLIGDADSVTNPARLTNGEVVIVESVRELHGIKLFKIKGALRRTLNAAQVVAFKLGRSFHHFGYNGAQKIVKPPPTVTATSTTSGSTTTTTTNTSVQENNVSFSRYLDVTLSISFHGLTYAVMTGSLAAAFSLSGSAPVTNVLEPGPGAYESIVKPDLSPLEFPLDAEVKDLPSGVRLIMQGALYKDRTTSPPKDFTLVRTITNVKPLNMTWGLMTAMTSMVTLNQSLVTVDGNATYNLTDIRNIQFHEAVSPSLTLKAGVTESVAARGTDLYFYGTDAEAQSLKGRRLYFTKPETDAFIASVAQLPILSGVDSSRRVLRPVRLDREVTYADYPNENTRVTVYGNLVDATQGKTEAEAVLGNGDSRQLFQTFRLPKSPLTYLLSTGETPPETPELEVYVDDRLWKRVPSLFGRKLSEEIYIVREDSDGVSWVQFGDGKTGARLPSGIKNVVAKYRTGAGAHGNVKPNTKVQAGRKLDRLDKVQMPGIASGGSIPEDGESAREAAPGKIQSLDRLVSLKDFESETLSISGVTRATASWELKDNVPAVVITVLMETGRHDEIAAVRDVLNDYNRCRGAGRFPVIVRQGELQYVAIDAVFVLDPVFREDVVRTEIEKALGVNSGKSATTIDSNGLFNLRRRRFGQREYATSIAGAIQNVAGVRWAKVTIFSSLGEAKDPADAALLLLPRSLNNAVACDSLHILSLYRGHLNLSVISAPAEGVCSG
jgi:hypothetical protein